ncbi:hypothetical protein [Polaromonas sp.]|uniref:hypothetical protein n=1 Tax=Polaromonas sp. TaxID=1869339 RepID=UPI00286B2A2A|nr:hypothetical protein [Polaromonas sp.]
MKKEQLLHVLRAAADISGEKSFVIVGSQAILLALQAPDEGLTLSDEVDLYPSMAPEKSEAGREKDAEFVRILRRDGHVSIDTLTNRIAQIDGQKHNIPVIVAWAERRWREIQGNPTP